MILLNGLAHDVEEVRVASANRARVVGGQVERHARGVVLARDAAAVAVAQASPLTLRAGVRGSGAAATVGGGVAPPCRVSVAAGAADGGLLLTAVLRARADRALNVHVAAIGRPLRSARARVADRGRAGVLGIRLRRARSVLPARFHTDRSPELQTRLLHCSPDVAALDVWSAGLRLTARAVGFEHARDSATRTARPRLRPSWASTHRSRGRSRSRSWCRTWCSRARPAGRKRRLHRTFRRCKGRRCCRTRRGWCRVALSGLRIALARETRDVRRAVHASAASGSTRVAGTAWSAIPKLVASYVPLPSVSMSARLFSRSGTNPQPSP